MAPFNITGKVIDVYDDEKKDLLKDNLEKVGSLVLDPVDKIDVLGDDQFAAIFMTKTGRAVRKYPVHTPDSTIISNLYFQKTASSFPEQIRGAIASFIKKACDKHGIDTPGEVEKVANGAESNIIDLRASIAGAEKRAYKNYAIGGHYPIDTVEQVKCACEYFDENHILFTPEDRNKFAGSVSDRSQVLGVDVDQSSEIFKYAGASYGNIINLAKHERENLLQDDEMAKRALSHLFEKKASLKPHEFAKELDRFDRTNRLDVYWDKSLGIRDPYKSTYESVKIASVIKVGSMSISEDSLHAVAQSGMLKEAFDDEFCAQFNDAPVEIFNSLPDPEKKVIIGIAGDL